MTVTVLASDEAAPQASQNAEATPGATDGMDGTAGMSPMPGMDH